MSRKTVSVEQTRWLTVTHKHNINRGVLLLLLVVYGYSDWSFFFKSRIRLTWNPKIPQYTNSLAQYETDKNRKKMRTSGRHLLTFR